MTSKVPRDPNMSSEVRSFLDDLARKKSFDDLTVTTLTVDTVTVGGLNPFLQGGDADEGLNHNWVDHGTLSTGTLTIDPLDGYFQKVALTGAVAIEPSASHVGSCLLHITNGASANGSFSGWTKKYPSVSITTTNGHKFGVMMFFYGALGADYSIQARQ